MNEDTLRRAAAAYEQIIQDYPNDERIFDAYFASAYISMEYLQGVSDYEHAANLLELLINNHPSNNVEVADAYLTLAHLNYRCLRDYRATQESLSELLNNSNLSMVLGAREIEVKTLLAKCRQKLGEYEEAARIWEELEFVTPGTDTEGRLQWIRDSYNWFQLDDGTIRLFFDNTIERSKYIEVVNELHNGLTEAESRWGLLPGGAMDVYLFKSSDQLFDYTDRSEGFALPIDYEIYISTDEIDLIPYLTGLIVSSRINTRPDGTVFPWFRAGFNNYFMADPEEIDRMAAHEIYYYGGTIDGDLLLFPLSFDYTYSEEYRAMAASFMHYLVEGGRVDAGKLETFYKLLWSNPEARIRPPIMGEIERWMNQVEGEAVSWQDTLMSAAYIYEMFNLMIGVDLQGEIAQWQASLSDEIQQVETELGDLSASVTRVEVDLSTPEKALETWWNAYRAGDFDAMIQSSTQDMASFLEEARQYYIEQGVLDQVIVEYFVRPYRSARMVVTRTGSFADNIYVYDVNIETGDRTEPKTIVVRLEGNLWKVDTN
jgi:tetratricopeptide (TPR) repeat protein